MAPKRLERRFIRYWFDSNQARQTVRWGRFRGLEFAPETGAKRALNRDVLQGCLRTFAAFERFFGRKPGRAGFRKRALRTQSALNPHRTRAGIQNPPETRPQSGFAATPAPKTIADFATGLIAAKPVKSCDRCVFEALNSLLKTEQNGL